MPEWVKVESQTEVRETEALKARAMEAVSQIKKTYSDIVTYQQKYSPQEGLSELEKRLTAYSQDLSRQLAAINRDVAIKVKEAIAEYQDQFGLAEAAPVQEEAMENR